MKNKNLVKIGAIALLFGFSACQKSDIQPLSQDAPAFINLEELVLIPDHYIVEFHEHVIPVNKFKADMNYDQKVEVVKEFALNLEKEISGIELPISHAYHSALKGFAGELSPEMVAKLKQDPRVKSVRPDYIVSLGKPDGAPGGGGGKKGDDGGAPAETTPAGITRVGGGASYTGSKVAWVIDSGVDLDHDDLNIDGSSNKHKSFVKGSADDQHGHGTHVAGTIGAVDNTIGVVGVAAGVEIISVRVLDRRGSGTVSGVTGGIDWVADNASAGDVANMSLGGGANTTIDNAVKAAAAKGILFAIAAGNDSRNASNYSPARVNVTNVYTISAMNSSDNWASFSNYGSVVDYCQPGVSILSTWKGNNYNTISGTSMACPHFAGLLLWWDGTSAISTNGNVKNDPDGNADPIAVK